jgi:hypothetical protein
MLALAGHVKPELGEDPDGRGVADAGQLGHGSHDHEILFDVRYTGLFRLDLQPLPDRL